MSYLSPGVYVEEKSSGVKPIEGVGTSTGAFVGIAEKGMVGKAVLITNWTQFVKEFGNFIPNGFLAYAVYSFFSEGGTSCYVVRATSDKAKSASTTIKDKEGDGAVDALSVTARSEGVWGNRITVIIEDPSETTKKSTHFNLTVKYKELHPGEYEGEETAGQIVETFDTISVLDVNEKVNGISSFVNVIVKPAKLTDDTGKIIVRPVNTAKAELSEGVDGLDDPDYIGTADNKKGLHAFDEVDDINIVAIPDKAGDREVIINGLNYCKDRTDCFFIADTPYGLDPQKVENFKKGTGDYAGNAFNSSFGALYYPWIYISDPLTGKKKLVPPSGLVAGSYAYTDSTRGVHKAAAGIVEGYLDSAVGIERIVTKGEHNLLNPLNVNVIRSFPTSGICIWGARTLSADAEWKYINIRRLFLFLEESLDKASQWVVFEPNSPALWGSVIRNITAFLLRVWRDGALFGSTPEEAFFVKVDEENNPEEVRNAGQLIIEVGVAPVRPAEFVIIRIKQKTQSK